MRFAHPPTGLSRRRFVTAGVALATLSLIPPVSAGWAATQIDHVGLFMQVSRLISRESLSPQTGAALYGALKAGNPTLDEHLRVLATMVTTDANLTIESLVDVLKSSQQPQLLATVHSMVAAWYTGIVDHRTYAYEGALMYRPTRDVLCPPSYTRGGPLNWANSQPPLIDLDHTL